MNGLLGVGFVGAGPVTQAIHLPTLATLADRFSVVHVMDVDEHVACEVAARAGARWSTQIDELLGDPDVDVVAICSPHKFHADHVVRACEAGKRAVLCEKPLATTVEEARRIAAASRATGVPVLVGTMHAYDPAVVAALGTWAALDTVASVVRSAIYLPPNDVFTDAATELFREPPAPGLPDKPSSRELEAALLEMAVIGLAIHSIPLVRSLFPRFDEVRYARFLRPFGYAVTLRCGSCEAQLLAVLPGQWKPAWTLDAWAPDARLRLDFPPSYVLAGSATAELSHRDSSRRWRFETNGYQAEWLEIADIATRGDSPSIPLGAAVDDLAFALEIVDGAVHALEAVS